MNWPLFSILIVLQIIILGWLFYYQRTVRNWADIDSARDLNYEAEKGKNLATKEDLAEITRQIEKVKSEISFESQRKKDYIEERKKHLVNILYYAEKLQNAHNRLMLYGRNVDMQGNLYKLIDDVNEYLTEMMQEGNMILAEYFGLEDLNVMSTLIDDASILVGEITIAAHNAAISMNTYKIAKEESEKHPVNATIYLAKAKEATDHAAQEVCTPLESLEKMRKDIQQYVLWLHRLIGKGLNYKYKINDGNNEMSV